MTSYTDVFTGNPIQSSPTNFNTIAFSSNTQLSWPVENEDNGNTTSDILECSAGLPNLFLSMPPANQVGNGKSCILKNIGINIFTVLDDAGNTLLTIAPGAVWWLYVRDNSTLAGIWGSFQYGSTTSYAQASSLAGAGLTAQASLLNLAFPIQQKNSNYNINVNDRASVLLWAGGGGTFTLPSPSNVGNDWFIILKNSGSGALTISPTSGQIDDASTATLNINGSAIITTDGANYYTIGLGNAALTTFTRLVKSVAGGSNVTLSSAEAAYNIQEYTGTLTANIEVIVPTAVGYWYVYNNTTGSFSLTVQTSSGTGIAIVQGNRRIIHCDGTNVVFSDSLGSGTVTQINTGTGLTGGPIGTTGTIALANTSVIEGNYGNINSSPNLIINKQGQVTFAANSIISLPINRIRNGNLNIWNRGINGTVASNSFNYTADGWIILTQGSSVTWSQYASAGSDALCKYSLGVIGNTGNTGVEIAHRIESLDCYPLYGTDQNITVRAIIYNNTGFDFTPTLSILHANSIDNFSSLSIDVNSVNLQMCNNASWTLVSYTFTPTNGATNGLQIQLNLGPINSTTKIVQVTEFAIFPDPSASAGINNNPPFIAWRNLQDEITLNSRYLPAFYSASNSSTIGTGLAISASQAYFYIPFSVPTRIIPYDVKYSSASDFVILDQNGAGHACTLLGINTLSPYGIELSLVIPTSILVPGNSTIVRFGSSSGYLIVVGAEL